MFRLFYRPPVVRVSDKVMIPQEEHPDINFVGLLIGPRGNTLKNLEKDVRLSLHLSILLFAVITKSIFLIATSKCISFVCHHIDGCKDHHSRQRFCEGRKDRSQGWSAPAWRG